MPEDSKPYQLVQTCFCKTIFGELVIGSFKGKICLCDWHCRKLRNAVDNRIERLLKIRFSHNTSSHHEFTHPDTTAKIDEHSTQELIKQLEEYFRGQRQNFDIPIINAGTGLQHKVWSQIEKIPCGKTISYKDIANTLDQPNAVRAIGSAVGANALAFLIPCHRVIESSGGLGGYAGGIPIKKRILKHEQAVAISMPPSMNPIKQRPNHEPHP